MNRYLIDTQTIIWAEYEPHKLSEQSKSILSDSQLIKCISLVSIWEISIKQTIGKLEFEVDWSKYIELQSLDTIHVTLPHIMMTKRLELIHRDPFDRLLIAQSIVEQMPLITSDKVIQQYDFQFIKA